MKIKYRTELGNTGFWIKDALGIYVFFETHCRKIAQNKCDEMFGVNKYTVCNRGSKN